MGLWSRSLLWGWLTKKTRGRSCRRRMGWQRERQRGEAALQVRFRAVIHFAVR